MIKKLKLMEHEAYCGFPSGPCSCKLNGRQARELYGKVEEIIDVFNKFFGSISEIETNASSLQEGKAVKELKELFDAFR